MTRTISEVLNDIENARADMATHNANILSAMNNRDRVRLRRERQLRDNAERRFSTLADEYQSLANLSNC